MYDRRVRLDPGPAQTVQDRMRRIVRGAGHLEDVQPIRRGHGKVGESAAHVDSDAHGTHVTRCFESKGFVGFLAVIERSASIGSRPRTSTTRSCLNAHAYSRLRLQE